MEALTPASASPPFTAEANPSAVDSPQQEQPESQGLTTITNSRPATPPPSEDSPTLPLAGPSPPPFINLVAELKDLSLSIAAFHQCYEDLHNHIDSIKAAIFSKLPLPGETLDITPPPLSILDNVTSLPPSSLDITPLPSSSSPQKDVSTVKIKEDNLSELEGLCSTMCSRSIRRYLINNLSDLPKLREEVPKALKLAPSPAKLVIECLGKFFLQGTRAYTKNSPMIPAREASIFMLECFLLMMGMDGKDNKVLAIENSVKEEAKSAALGWRNRLVGEGGLDKANRVDARGLLLLVACFGIPNSFHREDLRDLLLAAKAKEIVGLLQKSQLLMNKIPDIVEGLMKNKMKVDAVDIACTFGLEERFDPQIILLSYLQELQETWKKPKKGPQGSAAPLKEALSALKSVRGCLERHKIDSSKLLPGWEIGEKISTLEKEIADLEKKTAQKRKSSEAESSKMLKAKEGKRSRHIDQGQPHQKSATPRVDSRRNTLPSNNHLNYPGSSSVIYGGPGAGLIPEGMLSSGGISVSLGALSTNLYSRGVLVDTGRQVLSRAATQQQPYVYDAALVEKYAAQPPVGLTSLYKTPAGMPNSSPAVVGSGSRSSGGSDLYNFADSVVERESYMSSVPRGVGAMPAPLPGHHPSYLYQV